MTRWKVIFVAKAGARPSNDQKGPSSALWVGPTLCPAWAWPQSTAEGAQCDTPDAGATRTEMRVVLRRGKRSRTAASERVVPPLSIAMEENTE